MARRSSPRRTAVAGGPPTVVASVVVGGAVVDVVEEAVLDEPVVTVEGDDEVEVVADPVVVLARVRPNAARATTMSATEDHCYGQLGNGSSIGSTIPVTVTGITDATTLAGGGSHTSPA